MSHDPTVFVVDDDPGVLGSTAALLRAANFDVETFGSAETFLDEYDPKRIGCLLLDIRLPGMNGLELHEKLKADGTNLPVILISGHANAEVRHPGEVGGALAVLEKPIGSHQLIEWVNRAVSK